MRFCGKRDPTCFLATGYGAALVTEGESASFCDETIKHAAYSVFPLKEVDCILTVRTLVLSDPSIAGFCIEITSIFSRTGCIEFQVPFCH